MKSSQDIALATEVRTALSRLIRQLRKQVANHPLSLTEHATLALLDQHGELLPSELAAMEKVTAQAMSQSLNKMEELGYIKRTPAPDDKRKVHVSLSKQGGQVLAAVRSNRSEWLAGAMSALLTAEEKKILKQAASIIQKLADHE